MKSSVITTLSDITLVTLQNCPCNFDFITKLFDKIAERQVNVDMISLAPAHGAVTSISFTIDDDDLGAILQFTSALHSQTEVKAIVSSGNCKISIYDERMKNTPGMAARVFAAAASVQTDIRIITTSDVEISLLVTQADFDEALTALKERLNEA